MQLVKDRKAFIFSLNVSRTDVIAVSMLSGVSWN